MSAPDVVYVDPFTERPIVGLAELTRYCEGIRGKISVARFDLRDEHVHNLGDVALLAFRFDAFGGNEDSPRWNFTEVWLRVAWRTFNGGNLVAHKRVMRAMPITSCFVALIPRGSGCVRGQTTVHLRDPREVGVSLRVAVGSVPVIAPGSDRRVMALSSLVVLSVVDRTSRMTRSCSRDGSYGPLPYSS